MGLKRQYMLDIQLYYSWGPANQQKIVLELETTVNQFWNTVDSLKAEKFGYIF